jgi:hypothetical protein
MEIPIDQILDYASISETKGNVRQCLWFND